MQLFTSLRSLRSLPVFHFAQFVSLPVCKAYQFVSLPVCQFSSLHSLQMYQLDLDCSLYGLKVYRYSILLFYILGCNFLIILQDFNKGIKKLHVEVLCRHQPSIINTRMKKYLKLQNYNPVVLLAFINQRLIHHHKNLPFILFCFLYFYYLLLSLALLIIPREE